MIPSASAACTSEAENDNATGFTADRGCGGAAPNKLAADIESRADEAPSDSPAVLAVALPVRYGRAGPAVVEGRPVVSDRRSTLPITAFPISQPLPERSHGKGTRPVTITSRYGLQVAIN